MSHRVHRGISARLRTEHSRSFAQPALDGATATEGLRTTARYGLTLVEVIIALAILGGVLIALGMFSVRLSQSTSAARFRVAAAQLAADRIEFAKGAPRYTAIETLTVATESPVTSADSIRGFTRQTWVQHVGGQLTDTIDYKTVTVQVTHPQMSGSVRKTTVIAPF
jgi:prepilin-type N-terminal cleavage/methylation domain-containing protein